MPSTLQDKYIIAPTTFSPQEGVSSPHLLDLNQIFWEHVFSKGHMRSVFNNHPANGGHSVDFHTYFDFIIDHSETVRRVTREALLFPFEERRLLYCFNIYIFILSILNDVYPDYNFTLAYGAHLKNPITNFNTYLSSDTDFFSLFYRRVMKDRFFSDDCRYVISIKWENDIFHALALSTFIKESHKNVSVWVDLTQANEQTDFSLWRDDPFVKKHIDGFANLYRGGAAQTTDCRLRPPAALRNGERYGVKKVTTRLFRGGCYWHKCTFCTINSRYQNDTSFETITEEAKNAVRRLVASLKRQAGLFFLVLADEAIAAEILLYFAEEVVAAGLQMRWNARTRFSPLFTDDNCRKLAASGLRFLGFGLESVNPRVLALMNKRERDYSVQEIDEIIRRCDENGINAHTYFILGFPSETKAETDETISFIEHNLERRRFFSFSANIFYLMKGSEIYNHPDRFGITIDDRDAAHKIGAIRFIDNSTEEKYSREELNAISKKLYARMFFRNPDTDFQVQLGYLYWDYLDRLNLFYDQKLVNRCNPYRAERARPGLSAELLDTRHYVLPLPHRGSPSGSYFNVIDNREISVPAGVRHIFHEFLSAYDDQLTLRANRERALNGLAVKDDGSIAVLDGLIQELLDSGLLYSHKTKEDIV